MASYQRGLDLVRRAVATRVVGQEATVNDLLVAWLALHWFILPHIQQWRAPIEARVGKALGIAVRIGTIEVRSSGSAVM